MYWRIERITGRFLAIMVSVSAIMAVLVAGSVAWVQFDEQRARLEANVAEVAALNAQALAEPMWALNDQATRSIIQSLTAHSAVACAEVVDNQTGFLSATENLRCAASNPLLRRVDQPVIHGGKVLGTLTLWVDEAAFLRTLRRDVMLTAMVFLLLTGAMVVTAVFALRATVMDPLRRLIAAIRRAGPAPPGRNPKDELGQVVAAYNDLLDRLAAHNREVEKARAQAVAAAEAKSRFLATMSHEIRTPMHGVLGTVELLRGTELSGEQQRFAEIIMQSTSALLGLINDILDLSKIEAGKVRIAPTPTSPSRVVQEVIGALAANARSRGIELDMTWSSDLPAWVMADSMRLRQVVMNLVGNAVKFTEEGSVTISLSRQDGRLVIAVTDTGIGMEEATLEQLFQPFRQADDSTTRRHGGSGLGLSISRQLVELMGGTIGAESRPGVGSTFRVTLPLIEVEAPPPPPEAQDLPPGNGALVLAAEDNPVNQWLLRSQLEKLGYRVAVHGDGAAALAAFEPGFWAAVVTDYHMPIMDGLELARRIRAAEAAAGAPPTPIIGLTADAFAETLEECRRVGMDEVVTKPISLEQLGMVLARRLGLAPEAVAPCAPGPAALKGEEAPLLDSDILAAICGDDAESRAQMAELFTSTARDLLGAVDAAHWGSDSASLAEAAHSLASASLSMGATRLGLAARALEHAAKDGAWTQANEWKGKVTRLVDETVACLQ